MIHDFLVIVIGYPVTHQRFVGFRALGRTGATADKALDLLGFSPCISLVYDSLPQVVFITALAVRIDSKDQAKQETQRHGD
jgi:hypothetical protein